MLKRLPQRIAALALALLGFGTYAGTTNPVAASSTGSPFAFNWAGTFSAPQPWNPVAGFDLDVHDRNFASSYWQPASDDAQHGADCSPFLGFGVGGTHTVSTYADSVFICNNHMMTTINSGGYGEVAFTPAQMLDWSHGPVTATWQVSTLRTSCRDWLSFNVMPFMDNLQLTDGIGVDLYDEPRNELLFTTGAACSNSFKGTDIRDFQGTPIPGLGGAVEDVVDTSTAAAAKDRQTFELDISSTHVRFGMPAFNKWFVDGNLSSPLPYSQAVLQFEQHSYTPDKDCNPTPTFCRADTWHWSNIAFSNSVPFTILRGSPTIVAGGHTNDTKTPVPDTVTLPAPAPANSYLRFEAVAGVGSLRFSTDGGRTWTTPTHQQPSQKNPSGALTDSQAQLFFWPIPAGTTSVKFDAADTYWTWNIIRYVSVWSAAGVVAVQNPPPPVQNQPPPLATQPPPTTSQPPTGEQTSGPAGETSQASGAEADGHPGLVAGGESGGAAASGTPEAAAQAKIGAGPLAGPAAVETELMARGRHLVGTGPLNRPIVPIAVVLLLVVLVGAGVLAFRLAPWTSRRSRGAPGR